MAVDKDKFVQMFVDILGQPTSTDRLHQYLELVSLPNETTDYGEIHHIFPKSTFPELKDNQEYQVRLSYENHVKAHVLLAEAYPIRKFIRPLNYMTTKTKNSELLSLSTKNWWKSFKKSDAFRIWKKKRSDHLKVTYSKDKSHIQKMSSSRWSNPAARSIVGEQFKRLWRDADYRKNTIESMRLSFNTDEQKRIRNEQIQARWNNPTFRESHRQTMSIVNKDETKRKKAGNKIKELWKTQEFREKALKRKKTFWWNNGTVEVKSDVCPDGYVRGRLKGHLKSKKDTTQ